MGGLRERRSRAAIRVAILNDMEFIMTEYEQIAEAILSIPKFTKEKHDLSVLRTYLEALGNPEQGLRVIHVAGTNGKGSVTRMLSGFLQKSGRQVGSFLSPHLVRMNERIRINGREAEDEAIVQAYRILEQVRKEHALPQLTFFELLFAMALLIFRREGMEDIVLETGLGGRLDATTSIPADLYVITEIGMDHEEYLGDTMESIAAEKAGIITGDSPVVFHTGHAGSPNETADRVIRERAETFGCRTIINCNETDPIIEEVTPYGIDFSFRNDYDRYDYVFLPTRALYQVENAVTAITAVRLLLPEMGKQDLKELIRNSLKEFRFEGRLEEMRPGIFADGAHNPSAARQLAGSVLRMAGEEPGRKLQLIFGASGDKRIPEVLKELSVCPWSRVILTRYEGSRSASVKEIRKTAGATFSEGTTILTAESLGEALQEAEKKKEWLTFVTGSLYLVGELRHMLDTE